MKDLKQRVMTGAGIVAVFIGSYFFIPLLFLGILAFALVWILLVEWPVVTGRRLSDYCYWLLSMPYPITGFVVLMYLTHRFAVTWPLVPLYPFIAASIVDVAAYFVGSLIGRHKCAPKISPNKTWEGLAGGVAALYLFNMSLLWWHGVSWNVPLLVISTPILAASAIFGDLFISWLKRRRGIKDTGRLLPGHGGLLDRLDSVLFIAMVVGVYLIGRIALGY